MINFLTTAVYRTTATLPPPFKHVLPGLVNTFQLVTSTVMVSAIISTIAITKTFTKTFVISIFYFSTFLQYPFVGKTMTLITTAVRQMKNLVAPFFPSIHFYEEKDIADEKERERLIEGRRCHQCLT